MRSNFVWTLFGSGVYGACQWGMLIALAKLGSADMVGRFALALALCAPVVMFTNLQLRNVQATDARSEYEYRDYLVLRMLSSSLAIALIAAIAALAGYRLEVLLVVLVVASAKVVESLSDVIYGRLQKRERLDLVAISMMLRGPGAVVLFAALIWLTGKVVWGAAGILAAWTLVLIGFDTVVVRRFADARSGGLAGRTLGTRLREVKRLAWLSLPLGIVGLLDSLNVNVPRYLIERSLGEAALGHFAAMAYIIVAGNMVIGALSASASPRLSRRYIQDISAFKRLIWKLVQFGIAFGVSILLLSVFFGREILSVLYTPEYAAHADVFAWLMLAAAFGYVARFLVWSMTAARYLKAQTPLYAAALLVLSTLCVWLIPTHGLLGAAWAICAGMLALLVGASLVNLHAIRARTQASPNTVSGSRRGAR
jgi:O-antigen/teichoic acid export membrane protein